MHPKKSFFDTADVAKPVTIIMILGILLMFGCQKVEVTNFKECLEAGNSAMESYPRQCMHEGVTYIEEIEPLKNTIEVNNSLVTNPENESIEDLEENQTVIEELVNNEIELEKHYCPEKREKNGLCAQEYDPVCGWFNENIQCVKYPCAKTYSNSCHACLDLNVEYWTKGECPE